MIFTSQLPDDSVPSTCPAARPALHVALPARALNAALLRRRDTANLSYRESRVLAFLYDEGGTVDGFARMVNFPCEEIRHYARTGLRKLESELASVMPADFGPLFAAGSRSRERGECTNTRRRGSRRGVARIGASSRGDPDGDPDPPASSGTPPTRRLTSRDTDQTNGGVL